MQKGYIKEIVVVEGHSDTNKLKKLFDVETIETNGFALDEETINLIKKSAKTRGVILFLDPDGPGEAIRKKISIHLDYFQNIFIDPNKIKKNSKKIGVAEAQDSDILEAFKNIVTFDKNIQTISWDEYLSLNLNTQEKRKQICDLFKISVCNNKQLFKRLNMMGIKLKDLKGKIIYE